MAYAWSGKFPENRVPKLKSLSSAAAGSRISAGSTHQAVCDVVDSEGDVLDYEWIVTAESTDKRIGGDAEAVPTSYPELTLENNGNQATFKAPNKEGAYRLFLTVRDNAGGAATANFPFYVER